MDEKQENTSVESGKTQPTDFKMLEFHIRETTQNVLEIYYDDLRLCIMHSSQIDHALNRSVHLADPNAIRKVQQEVKLITADKIHSASGNSKFLQHTKYSNA